MPRLLVGCLVALAAAVVVNATAHAADETSCVITDDTRKLALTLSWEEFDQKSNSPASFRAFALRACYREAAELIEYYLANKPTLAESQQRNSRFHAGQMYGHAGDERRALELIRSARWPEQPANAALNWNTYVAGVVAFLEKDRAALSAAREHLESEGGRNLINARVLRRMEKCFDKSYDDVWKAACEVS